MLRVSALAMDQVCHTKAAFNTLEQLHGTARHEAWVQTYEGKQYHG